MDTNAWTPLQWNRYKAIYRLASICYYREQRTVHVFDRITELVRFYRKQSGYLSLERLRLLRLIESGAALYDTGDQYRCIHCFTYEDDDLRLYLRDSGLALLFSIDTNWIPPSPPAGLVWSLPPAQMSFGI